LSRSARSLVSRAELLDILVLIHPNETHLIYESSPTLLKSLRVVIIHRTVEMNFEGRRRHQNRPCDEMRGVSIADLPIGDATRSLKTRQECEEKMQKTEDTMTGDDLQGNLTRFLINEPMQLSANSNVWRGQRNGIRWWRGYLTCRIRRYKCRKPLGDRRGNGICEREHEFGRRGAGRLSPYKPHVTVDIPLAG
jgi:hypothetical protein